MKESSIRLSVDVSNYALNAMELLG
jgi:hypothetical protein